MYQDNPERFENPQIPFNVVEFGYASAEFSIEPITTII